MAAVALIGLFLCSRGVLNFSSGLLSDSSKLTGIASPSSTAHRGCRPSATALQATRAEWYRKVRRLPGNLAIFDVTIPKPLGLQIKKFPPPREEGVGVFEITPGGNAEEVNRKVVMDDGPGMWVLEGDQVLAVDGEDVEELSVKEIAGKIGQTTGNEVTLTLQRNTRLGPIRVVIMPEGVQATVRRGIRLSAATEYAGRESDFGCIDGWCGTCWHRERATNGVFKPCCDMLTGDWDNTMPLVLTPRPERAGDSRTIKPRGV